MARYERERAARFWEIERADVTVDIRWGLIGRPASCESKHFGTAAAASSYVARVTRAKLREGYILVAEPTPAPASPSSRNSELEAAIRAEPDQEAGYLVYADWLQAEGDPRGELAMLQHAAASNKRVAPQVDAFLKKHAAQLLGRFATDRPADFVLGWRLGFIESAHLGWRRAPLDRAIEPELCDIDWNARCAADLVEFLHLPSAAFLRSLSIGPIPAEREMDLGPVARVLERATPPCLRQLDLGDDDRGDWGFARTSAAIPSSPAIGALQKLSVSAGTITVGALDLPELRELRIHAGGSVARDRGDTSAGLDAKALSAIAGAKLPKLERLDLAFGQGATCRVRGLAPILNGRTFPKLRHLRLAECPFSDELAGALVKAKVLARLETLDLDGGTLSDDGLAVMSAAKSAFQHLTLLDLGDNALTKKISKPLAKGLAKNVDFGWRQAPRRRR